MHDLQQLGLEGRFFIFQLFMWDSDSGPMEPGVDHTGADLENNSTHAPSVHVSMLVVGATIVHGGVQLHPCERPCEILSALV